VGAVAPTNDPGRQAAADVEQARALLTGAVRLVPMKRGAAGSTTQGPTEVLEDRVEALCDRIAGLVMLQYPHARRPSAKLRLP
jgi:hypothetical protein